MVEDLNYSLKSRIRTLNFFLGVRRRLLCCGFEVFELDLGKDLRASWKFPYCGCTLLLLYNCLTKCPWIWCIKTFCAPVLSSIWEHPLKEWGRLRMGIKPEKWFWCKSICKCLACSSSGCSACWLEWVSSATSWNGCYCLLYESPVIFLHLF